jgi:hypothetical protein
MTLEYYPLTLNARVMTDRVDMDGFIVARKALRRKET